MSWKEMMDAQYADAEGMKDYQDINGLAKSHIELQKMIGGSIRIPSADASAEDRQAFYDKITSQVDGLAVMPNPDDAAATAAFWEKAGTPKAKDDYTVKEGVDQDAFNELRDMALTANLTKKQFEALTEGMTNAQVEALEAAKVAMTAGQTELFNSWGAAKDKNLEAIKNLMKGTDAPADMLASLEAGTLDATFMGWAAKMASQIGSEGQNMGDQGKFGKSTDMLAPAEAESQINDIMNNKEGPYWNNGHSGHKAIVEKVIRLQHMANGNTPPQ